MDIVFIILGTILTILAIIGSVLPVLPSLILMYFAFIFLQLTSAHPFSWIFFIVRAVIVIFLIILEYIIPSRGTKKYGGTKRGVRGSKIGLVLGVIVLPLFGIVLGPFGLLGLIGGPFLGAYLGEKYAGSHHEHALRAARGSFIGFIAGNFLKLVVCLIMAGYFFVNVYDIVFK